MPPPKVILITGCSSGFGLLIAARLASRGHHVVATMRNLGKQGALLQEVKERGGAVIVKQLDVTDKLSIKKAVCETAGEFGHIDVLVNNAAYGIGGFFEDLTDEEIREQFETNFFGTQNVIREVLPCMRPAQKGKIITISSIAGLSASPCFGAYNASKWALEGFCESLRHELRLFGIDVLLIEPGTFKTKIFYENARYAKYFANPTSPYFEYSRHLAQKVKSFVDDCFKDPENVAALVEKLINASNPSFRNIPDIEAQTMCFLRRILPFKIYSWIIRTALFSDFKKKKTAASPAEKNGRIVARDLSQI